jgi:hypothetical protein
MNQCYLGMSFRIVEMWLADLRVQVKGVDYKSSVAEKNCVI